MIFAALGGWVFGSSIGIASGATVIVAILSLLSVGVFTTWFRLETAQKIAVFLAFAAWGCSHAQDAMERSREPFADVRFQGSARIVRVPEVKDRSQDVVMRFEDCGEMNCPKTLLLARFPIYERLRYGDRLSFECDAQAPKNDGLHFDYRRYLSVSGIDLICFPKDWRREEVDTGLSLLRGLFRARETMETSFDRAVPYPESGLGKGLLFGGGNYLTKATQNDFARTGMSHIVAVSGSNVAVIARIVFLVAIACGLWRKWALVASGLGIIGFVLLTGAQASAIRAGVSGVLAVFASANDRISDGMRLWLFALAAMLWWNPLSLRYDIGFQLSFAATLGILCGLRVFRERRTNRGWLFSLFAETILMTLFAEAFIFPIVWYHFRMFSLVSLPANALILPLLPYAMLLSFLAAFFGLFPIFWPLTKLCAISAYVFLHAILSLVHTFAAWSWAIVSF
jgi:competence protein ComEC